MADPNQKAERELFEAWAVSTGPWSGAPFGRFSTEEYRHPGIQNDWKVWQAARRASPAIPATPAQGDEPAGSNRHLPGAQLAAKSAATRMDAGFEGGAEQGDELPPLPEWSEAMHAVDVGSATPLEAFIYANEPAGDSDETHFREQLRAAIKFCLREYGAACRASRAKGEAVYQYRQRAVGGDWIECRSNTEALLEDGATAGCFEFRTLYTEGAGAAADALDAARYRAALQPFATAYAPEAARVAKFYTPRDLEQYGDSFDRNTITPAVTMGDFRRAYEALAARTSPEGAADA